MIRIGDIIENIKEYNPEADIEMIERAYVYSARVHKGQLRRTGEPYLVHPLEVSWILTQFKLGESSIVAGLLHDTLEDTYARKEEIEENFGKEITELVEGVTKISKMTFPSQEERQVENIRKMILATSKDIRILLIKLADRLHNMRTLEFLPEEKQLSIAQETLEIYAPLSNRMGIFKIRSELEDLSLRFLKRDVYKELVDKVNSVSKERTEYIEKGANIIQDKLSQFNLNCKVTGRPKHYYSIYQKMLRQEIAFEAIYDLIAFRIIVDSLKECYEVLGIIHSSWKPVPGRFKDFIALPKANGYQSLHTIVIGPFGERIEIQIRTKEMHRIAELGIAAHWKYKEEKPDEEKTDHHIAWVRELLEWQQNLKDPREFLDMVRIDLFPEAIFLFTPRGDIKELPRGATPIDFAYNVHTEIGHHCVGAKANGRIVPLNKQLKSGDMVEILTNPNQNPSKDWLKFIKTSRARSRINNWIKTEEKIRSIAKGKSICAKEFRRHNLNFNKIKKQDFIKYLKEWGLNDFDELLASIGFGKTPVKKILNKFIPKSEIKEEKIKIKPTKKEIINKSETKNGVIIKGIKEMMIRYGNCCNPLPGDEIVGYITRGRGVTIHTKMCPYLKEADEERKVEALWNKKTKLTQIIKLKIYSLDRKGLLANITSTISKYGINIKKFEGSTINGNKAINNFELEIINIDQLIEVMDALKGLKGILSVDRVRK
jgi:GTP pyrophosphokinase